MAHAEEPSPFGSYGTTQIPDDAGPQGATQAEETVASVLESPFFSAQIDEDEFQGLEKKAKNKEAKAQASTSSQPQLHHSSTTSTTSSSVPVSGSVSIKGAATADMNNAPSSGVVDMLESPFVSACLSQDVADTLTNAAAAADQLVSATAGVKIR
jgi:hypothetical protein